MKSWNEIRKWVTAFSQRARNACDEKTQTQTFLKESFALFGVDTVVFNLFEHRAGRQIRAEDAAGITTFAYDEYGAIMNETVIGVAGTNTIERFYDSFGRDAGYALNGVRQSTLGYDPVAGRLASMEVSNDLSPTPTQNSNLFTWNYLPGSDLKSSLAYPNGLTASWQYDANGQLLQVRNAFPTNIISQYDYTYDDAGRRVSCVKSGTAFTHDDTIAYGYNVRSELTNAIAAVDSDYRYAYDFDDIGNRETSFECGTNSVYVANQLNQYISISNFVSSVSFVANEFSPLFDDDGNQTLVKIATGIWSVIYNAENRPIEWSNGVTNITMKFDRMGRRVEYVEIVGSGDETITNAHHRFVYDGYLCIQRLNVTANNAIDLIFAWDPAEPVATCPLMIEKLGVCMLHVTHDGNKNISDLVFFKNGSGVAAHYEYAPFGALTVSTRNSTSTSYDFRTYNPFRFSSEYADDTLGLVYYNYRHYEPVMGRWLTRESIGENSCINLFIFTANSQENVDVLGLMKIPIAPNVLGSPILDDGDCTKCYLIRLMLFTGAGIGGDIGRRIYNLWANGGGELKASPDDFDKSGALRRSAFNDIAENTLRSSKSYIPCEEITPLESGDILSYPSSDVYAIRGFKLSSSCSLKYEPVCKECKCITVKVYGSCNFEFKDEFVFRETGSFAAGLIDEKTVKMCAEKFNWGIGSVYTSAHQDKWQGETYIKCPEEKPPPGWLSPIVE